MNGHSNEDNDSAALPAASSCGVLRGMTGIDAQRMSLEGGAALDLYLAEIGRNADRLQAQAALLQSALQERQDLLRELQSSQTGSADLTNKADRADVLSHRASGVGVGACRTGEAVRNFSLI